jgi:nucleotide-binding universal stress UspA family protein
MRHAAALQAELTVVAVHEVPKSYWGNIPVIGPADESLLGKLQRAAEEMMQQAADQLGDDRPDIVHVRAVNGFPVRELVDASRDAEMLVVGTPGGSSFSRLVMGSLTNEVVQHSECPVVIVPFRG